MARRPSPYVVSPSATPFSTSELDAAWRRVRDNDGCAGADTVTVSQFARRAESLLSGLRHALAGGWYRAFPLLQIEIAKRGNQLETRRLLVPTVRDRVAQTAAARRILPEIEDHFLDASFAYRPRRGVDEAIARVCQLRDRGFRWGIKADIDGFFDHVDHDVLLAAIARVVEDEFVKVLVPLWLEQRIWTGASLLPLLRGIPQGSPLSPFLANLFLAQFDEALIAAGFKLTRYADDLVVLVKASDERAAAIAAVDAHLAGLGLRLNASKTSNVTFEEGFTFLGVHLKGTDAWVPWKAHRQEPKVVSVASPMPATLRRALLDESPPSADSRRKRPLRPRAAPPPVESHKKEDDVSVLYVTEQGAVVRKSGQRVLIEKSSELLLDEPLAHFDGIVIVGQVQVTAHALTAMAEAGIRVAFVSRTGAPRAFVVPEMADSVMLRLKQFARLTKTEEALVLARAVVDGKLTSSIATLERYARNGDDVDTTACERVRALKTAVGTAASIAELNGIEGTAARLYFDGLMHANKSAFTWEGRRRRPATDPLNGLLSFGYTLLAGEVRGLIMSSGLEPGLGFLHSPDDGRPSLALDLMEPFRAPVVDRLTLTLVNRQQLSAQDFVTLSGGEVRLTDDGLRRYLRAYEDWIEAEPGPSRPSGPPTNYRRAIRREVARLTTAIRRETAWVPEPVAV